jgi:hypothetical protein
MTPMATKPQKQETTHAAKSGREGVSFTLWLPKRLRAVLDAYVEESRPRTTAKAVIEVALEDYFKAQGRWPPPSD